MEATGEVVNDKSRRSRSDLPASRPLRLNYANERKRTRRRKEREREKVEHRLAREKQCRHNRASDLGRDETFRFSCILCNSIVNVTREPR